MSQDVRMLHRDHRIYASAPLRRLADEQTRAMLPDIQRSAGIRALSLDASADGEAPVLPMIGCWVRMWIAADGYRGDVCATADAPLPFLDEAFDVVLLRHALEVVAEPSVLLGEAMRVLVPGGVLVLTGVHPVSGWAPWFYWRSRGPQVLRFPGQLGKRLERHGLEIEWIRRVGRAWPGDTASHAGPFNPCGGGYVLMARKRCRRVTPLRILPARLRVASGSLSPGTRRSAVFRFQRHGEQR
jgi:SAM-dependent methyltransferase